MRTLLQPPCMYATARPMLCTCPSTLAWQAESLRPDSLSSSCGSYTGRSFLLEFSTMAITQCWLSSPCQVDSTNWWDGNDLTACRVITDLHVLKLTNLCDRHTLRRTCLWHRQDNRWKGTVVPSTVCLSMSCLAISNLPCNERQAVYPNSCTRNP